MRILFLSRASLYVNPGGDTSQMEQTAQSLRNLGVDVDIATVDQRPDYSKYDLIHFFNIIRPADILYHVEKSKLPFVVSTIYVDYSLVDLKGWKSTLLKIVGKFRMEYIKTIARHLLNGEKIQWTPFWYQGQKKAIQRILSKAAYLLPNSESEYRRLKNDFPSAGLYEVVPNGVNLSLFDRTKLVSTKREKNKVLCVARIEKRKNQHKLIEALNDTSFELYLIGKPSTNQQGYYQYCKSIASKNIHFINGLSQEELLPHYASAKVHVLPSWFETTGLSSLEAAMMGCTIVVSENGDTRDYFQNDVFYCDPSDVKSIYSSIVNASNSDYSKALENRILQFYNWNYAAEITLNVYNKIILG